MHDVSLFDLGEADCLVQEADVFGPPVSPGMVHAATHQLLDRSSIIPPPMAWS